MGRKVRDGFPRQLIYTGEVSFETTGARIAPRWHRGRMTIVAFIAARLDAVAATARRLGDERHRSSSGTAPMGVQQLKLARVEVMRAVLAEHECDRFSGICLTCRRRDSHDGWASESWPCPTIRQLAALWADHPAYDQAWVPDAHAAPVSGPRTTRHRLRLLSGS